MWILDVEMNLICIYGMCTIIKDSKYIVVANLISINFIILLTHLKIQDTLKRFGAKST